MTTFQKLSNLNFATNYSGAGLKKGWEEKKLGEICKVIAGQSPEGKYYNNSGNGLPFYQGKKEFTEKYIGAPTTWTTNVPKVAFKDDILMSVRAPVGPVNFCKEKICIGRGLAAIRVTPMINKEFLFNFLLLYENKIIGNTGAVFNSINKSQIESIQIALPSISEQQRIIRIFDDSFIAVTKVKEIAEKNLQNARDLFESYLKKVFNKPDKGWEEKSLSDCFKMKSGDGLTSKDMNAKGKYPVYGGNGITGMHNNFNLAGNNIIIGRVGALCGNVRYINEKLWLTDNAFRIVDFKYDFDYLFLTYLLNFKNLRNSARQAAQPVISNSSLANILLQFPKSITEQRAIVAKLDALAAETKKLETIYEKKLADLHELKKSILQKAFNGELT